MLFFLELEDASPSILRNWHAWFSGLLTTTELYYQLFRSFRLQKADHETSQQQAMLFLQKTLTNTGITSSKKISRLTQCKSITYYKSP